MHNEKNLPEKLDPSLLIAVDGSRSSYHAVNYALHVTRLSPNLGFTLLHVLPPSPPLIREEAALDGAMLRKLRKLEALNRERAGVILEKARHHLLKHKVEPEAITTIIRPSRGGLAKDIINEAELGHFDALVVGRRGLTRTQEIFMGSVSSQVFQHAANVPLWIIDGQISEPRILVAVDGSSASLRAVDHVAFMLGGNPEARIHFVHVVPKLQSYCPLDFGQDDEHWRRDMEAMGLAEEDFRRESDACLQDFYMKAVTILRRAGFSPDRIGMEYRTITLGIARTIITAAKEGGYGTLVLGRRGLGRNSFLGGVTDRVLRRVEDLAVWLVG